MVLDETRAKQVLKEVQELYEDASNHLRTTRLNRIVRNAAFYRGLQYLMRGGQESIEEGESAQVVNICRPIISKAVADTIRQIPEPRIGATKDDQQSRIQAKMAERFCRSITRTNIIDEDEIHRCVNWMKQTGAGWIKAYWDPKAGGIDDSVDYTGFEKIDPDTGESTHDMEQDDGFGNSVPRQVFKGDMQIEFVSTLDGLPDPAARSRRELQYFDHRKLRPVRELVRRFPKDMFGEETKGRWRIGHKTLEQVAGRAIAGEVEDPFWSSATHQREGGNVLAELIEHWEPATDDYPFGRLVIFSDDMVLYMGPNIYLPTRLPFVLFNGDNMVPNALYADGLMEDIIQLQRNLNLNESKLFEHLDMMLNYHIFAPHGSGVVQSDFANRSGRLVNYNRGMKPDPFTPPDLSPSQFQYAETQIERAFMISGYQQAMGDLPANTSGRTYAFAEQTSQRMREPDQISFRRSMSDLFQHCLYLGEQFYDEGRLLTIFGENDEPDIIEYKSGDLKHNIIIDVYGEGPLSTTAQNAQVLDMMEAHMFDDGPAPERARRLLNDRYANKLSFDPNQGHKDRARRENMAVKRGNPGALPVYTYDIHKAHIQIHNDFRITPEFENLPDQLKQVMEVHCMLHEEYARRQGLAALEDQEGLQQQMQQQLMAGIPQPQAGQSGQQPGGLASAQTEAPPAPAPDMNQFANMDESEQRASDQA